MEGSTISCMSVLEISRGKVNSTTPTSMSLADKDVVI